MQACSSCGASLGLSGVEWTRLVCSQCGTPVLGLRRPADAPRVEGYEFLSFIGRGGMGAVYLVRNEELQRIEAMKVVSGSREKGETLIRFLREAEVAGRIRHPNIVQVYAFGSAEDAIYYTMPYVGPSLSQAVSWARQHDDVSALWYELLAPHADGDASSDGESTTHAELLTPAHSITHLICQRFARLADGLHAAHTAGVVHRDVKPDNILVSRAGVLQLMDFGLAHVRDDESLTRTGQLLGTPLYVSPEQLERGSKALDHRSDVYSLTVTLYTALLLQVPFRAEPNDYAVLFRRIRSSLPPRPTSIVQGFPMDLEGILLHGMQKDPGLRYQTLRELAEDLRRFVHFEPIKAQPVLLRTRAKLFAKRHRRPIKSLILAITLSLFAGSLLRLDTWREREANAQASTEYLSRAKNLLEAGIGHMKWSSIYADVQSPVDARIWMERGLEQLEFAQRQLATASRLVPDDALVSEQLAEIQVRQLLQQARLEELAGSYGRARATIESAELVARDFDRLSMLCRDARSSLELEYRPFPGAVSSRLTRQSAAGGSESVEMHAGSGNALPPPGVWTLVVLGEDGGEVRAPILILPAGARNQLIEVPLSPTQLARDYPGMILVPGGFARQGSLWDKQPNGQYGQRLAYVSPFLISRFEVTNQDFAAFLASDTYQDRLAEARAAYPRFASASLRSPAYPPSWPSPSPLPGTEDHPVIGISFVEAAAFAAWRGARLPSEQEWEKAGGGVLGTTFPWGDRFDRDLRLELYDIAAVGSRPRDLSQFGLFDVVANAAEWTSSIDLAWVALRTEQLHPAVLEQMLADELPLGRDEESVVYKGLYDPQSGFPQGSIRRFKSATGSAGALPVGLRLALDVPPNGSLR